jgi:hypothetical protein
VRPAKVLNLGAGTIFSTTCTGVHLICTVSRLAGDLQTSIGLIAEDSGQYFGILERKLHRLWAIVCFAQQKWAVAEDGATKAQQNTTYCGSRLTCPTDSGIFASAVVNRR